MTTQVDFFNPIEIVNSEVMIDYNKSVCWWDLHPFKRKCMISSVMTYSNNEFQTIGTFCSLNCAKAYAIDRHYDLGYFNLYCKLVFKRKLLPILKPAPKRECLTLLGGSITIKKFRENAISPDTFIRCVTYPEILITPSILETKCIEYKPNKILDIHFLEGDDDNLENEAVEFEKNRNKKKKRGRVGSKAVVLPKKKKKRKIE